MNKYKAFGLSIDSEIPLSGLPRGDGASDINIRFGDVPENLEGEIIGRGVHYQLNSNTFLQDVRQVAHYLVKDGKEIIIQAYKGAIKEEIALFALNTPIGVLLHQRGHIPLHACAIEINDRAVVIAGSSGAGKSTLLTAIVNRGFNMLTEEICAVKQIDNKPFVVPGPAYSYLWNDAVMHLGKDTKSLKGRINNPDKYKIDLSISYCDKTLALKKIYVLETKNSPGIEIEELKGFGKLLPLRNNVYRFRIGNLISGPDNMLKFNAGIGTHTSVKKLIRPVGVLCIDEMCDLILNDTQAQ